MKNSYLHTYNFIIINGNMQFQIETNAYSQDEAIDIILEQYPKQEGWNFILI